MENVLLAIGLLGTVILGFYIIRMVDKSLEGIHKGREQPGRSIRVAFESPAFVKSVAESIEMYSQKYPLYSFRFYSGTHGQIHEKLKTGEVDIGITLSGRADEETDAFTISFEKFCFLSEPFEKIEPLDSGNSLITVLWRKEKTESLKPLLDCLKNKDMENKAAL